MKVHITDRAVANTSSVVVCNHCPAMLNLCATPYGYNAGVYGWNFDVRHIGSCKVINGYRWVRKFREVPYNWARPWEDKAAEVNRMPLSQYDAARASLVSEFARALDDFVINGKVAGKD